MIFAKQAILLFALTAPLASVSAQSDRSARTSETTAGIRVYAAADDASPPVGILPESENVKPIAESQGAGGTKWYLVKTSQGVTGWIKQNDSEEAKRIADFFRRLPAEPKGIAIDIPTGSASTAPRGAVIVPIQFAGRAVIVPVTFNHSVTANLVLDTGASITMITDKIAANLRVPMIASGYLTGIGGIVPAQVARVDSVNVGDAEVGAMTISVHDPLRSPNFEGLLGMDFLGRFQVSVDPEKKLLILKAR
ncbi:MAG: aspartyl protease family protein [Chloroflexota bacterium]